MKHSLFLLSAVALLPLAACDQSATTAPANTEAAAANTTPPAAALPPSITQSVSLRCADDSVLFVDFFEGDTQINIRTAPDGPPTHLVAPEKGKPFVGSDYEVAGDAKSVDFSAPGKKKQVCKA